MDTVVNLLVFLAVAAGMGSFVYFVVIPKVKRTQEKAKAKRRERENKAKVEAPVVAPEAAPAG